MENIGDFCSEKAWSLIEEYCRDDLKKLNRMVNSIIAIKWANLPSVYHDELYDVALDTLVDCGENFDETKKTKFETFLYGSIQRKFKTAYRDRTRGKRCNVERDERGKIKKGNDGKPIVIPNCSINSPINDEGNTLEDVLTDNKDISSYIENDKQPTYSNRMLLYLSKLSVQQIQVLELISSGFQKDEILEKLHMKSREYTECIKAIRSYRNTSILIGGK